MTIRIVVLTTLSLAFVVAGFAAMWLGTQLQLSLEGPTSALPEDQEEWAQKFAWLSVLGSVSGPFVGAGLIAGVGALALVVRRRQVAGTRTVSAPASISVRNPVTTPNSSPSSSNSSARSNRTSNVDAFR